MKFCAAVLEIGNFKLKSPVLMAPMAGVTDWPFRTLCQEYGAGLTTSEMLTSEQALWNSNKSRKRLFIDNQSQLPHSIQIVGNDAIKMAEAAKAAEALGANIIDINMGCPAKKVCKKAAGSALMKDEALVADILQSVVNAVTIPVTLKIRTGWDEANKNAPVIAKIAEDSGIKALAIHGRTRACRFKGEAEYDTIATIKKNSSIPIIANGDIGSVEKACTVMRHTGADGIMIGRGAQGKPWLFEQINQAISGEQPRAISLAEKLACIRKHLEAIHTFYGDFLGLRIARKHMTSYLSELGLSKEESRFFNQLETLNSQLNFVDQLDEKLIEGQTA